jgi:hypothetical protein
MESILRLLNDLRSAEGLPENELELKRVALRERVNALKMYARWVKPYLRAAKVLEQNVSPSAASITALNTTLLEVVILAIGSYDLKEDVRSGVLPKFFAKGRYREYFPILLVRFNVRATPQRTAGRSGYAGRTDMEFTSYALNLQELEALREELDKDDLRDLVVALEGTTEERLALVQKDIEEVLGDVYRERAAMEEERRSEDVNPFAALFSFLRRKESARDQRMDRSLGIPRDSAVEKVIRSQAIIEARKKCFGLYEDLKAALGMPALQAL